MSPPRKFDHDEARRLRAEGQTYGAIARRLGVSYMAVYWVCNPESLARDVARKTAWQKAGTCVRCGGPATRNAGKPAHLCRSCADDDQVTSVRDGMARCYGRCRQWKPVSEFAPRRDSRRGLASECHACDAARKREYRARKRAEATQK